MGEKFKSLTQKIITESIEEFKRKEESVLISEIARLSKEGFLVAQTLVPNFESKENVLTVTGGLRLTIPKYDEALLEIQSLKSKLEKAKTALEKIASYESYNDEKWPATIAENVLGELG